MNTTVPEAAFQWVAHRGYPARYPENTLLGFQRALAAGARYLEADLQFSAEGEALIFHDDRLERLCGQPGWLHDQTWSRLEQLSPYIPGRFGDQFLGIPLLRLHSLLDLLREHPQVTLFLEIKPEPIWRLGVPEVLTLLMGQLTASHRAYCRQQLVLISYNLPVLAGAKLQGWPQIGPILTEWLQWQQADVNDLEAAYFFLQEDKVPATEVFQHPHGQLACYTVDDPQRASQLARQGATLIETDKIGDILAVDKQARVLF